MSETTPQPEEKKPEYTTRIHMCVDIEGVLRRSDRDLSNLFSEDGERRPGKYVRDWLKLQLAQGKRVLPMGECEGFDFQTGCPGHPIEKETASDASLNLNQKNA
jgi:hypothetical protein